MALTKIKLNTMVTGTLPDANIPDDITIDTAAAAPANALTGNTLASGVTASSLTSVGTLSSLTVSGVASLGNNSKVTSSSADTTFKIETTSGTTIFPVLDFVSSHSSVGAKIRQDGADVITIDNDQDVTFADDITVSGNSTLSGVVTASGSTGSNYIGSFTNASATGWGLFVKGGADNADYTLRVQDKDANDLLAVKSGGRTGFGTNDPESILHVKTSTNTSENIRIQNDDSMTTIGVSSDGYSFHTYQHSLYWSSWDGSNWSTKARLDNNGNWAIGSGSTVDTDKFYITDGASPYGGANRMIQLKRNATNGNDSSSFCSILFGNNSNGFTIGYGGTTDRFRFNDGGGVERFTIVNGGDVGINDTSPSTALTSFGSASKGLSIKNAQPTISFTDSDVTKRAHIAFEGGSRQLYLSSPESDGIITFQTGGFNERMRILAERKIAMFGTSIPQDFGDARGHLLISSEDNAGANNYAILQIQGHSINNDGSLGAIHFYDHNSSNASIQANRQNNSGSAKLMFSTSESGGNKKTRMTIYDAGSVLIDNDNSGSPAQLTVQNDGSTGWLGTWLVLNSKNHSNRGAGVTMHNQAADKGFFTGCRYQSGFDRWSICFEGRNYADQTTADSDHEVLHVNYDGAAYNDQNTWGSSSDERIKNSIVDSNSQWDDIKALKIKNYKLTKHGEDAPTLIGVIAQDLEESGMNGLVDETEADELQIARYEDINEGDKIKSVKYSVLYMKAIKALQEAMEKIETLETKVEALENA